MKHKIFVSFIVLEMILLFFLYIVSMVTNEKRKEEIIAKKTLVRELCLTDLAVWTEARYTRHPSQADLFTPFQDYPSSFEHFPAGSIVPPSDIVKAQTKIEINNK